MMIRIFFCLALFLGFAGLAQAQESTAKLVPDNKVQMQLSFAPLVKQSAPAVVNIYAKRVVMQRRSAMWDDPLFRQFFGNMQMPETAQKRVQSSLGSGVIVSSDGTIVTSAHVIGDSEDIKVALNDRREFDAKILIKDKRTDLAVLRIENKGEKFSYLKLRNSDNVEVGDLVLAIGNPFGVGQTVTSGIVSAQARTGVAITDFNFFIQTDAAINPGNSGGTLIDANGELIGINAAIYSQSGGSMGIGFAVPSNLVQTVLAAAGHGGKIVRPWLGASGQDVTSDLARALGLPRPGGVVISKVTQDSPADKAGLKSGDVILTIAGQPVDNPDAMRFRIATQIIGGDVPVKIWRDNKEMDMSFKALAAPAIPLRDDTILAGEQPLSGATIANISPALVEELDLPNDLLDDQNSVAIVNVKPGSYAAQFVRIGDKIVAVNNKKIRSIKDVTTSLKSVRAWRITILRDGKALTFSVRG